MWEDVCDEAAQLRTDLRRAKDKSEAEAQDAADYASKLHQQTIALYDSTKVTFSVLHMWSTSVPMTASSSRFATIANRSHTLAQLCLVADILAYVLLYVVIWSFTLFRCHKAHVCNQYMPCLKSAHCCKWA